MKEVRRIKIRTSRGFSVNNTHNFRLVSLQSSLNFLKGEHVAPRLLNGNQVCPVARSHIAQSFREVASGENNNSIT